jgi:CRISPR-associated endonuclease/helicase Cas3
MGKQLMSIEDFSARFRDLTNNEPFPWQIRLYCQFIGNQAGGVPKVCCIPTGLGKTSVIAVWLLAYANGAALPRRLIYVVNRRTVVDQTTNEVLRYKVAIESMSELATLKLHYNPLRISTLRGQFADNGDWYEDPAVPAVICGTVDMIGSRLLFSGYGIGRNKRPLHAGFLGQDALLIHDEAHLEPAFQRLIETIEVHQKEYEPSTSWPKLTVMELTATTKSQESFKLESDDYSNRIVNERMNAAKRLHLHPLKDPKKPAKELIEKALSFKSSGRAVVIFAQSVDMVLETQSALEKAKVPTENIRTLTGTMRGKERDALAGDSSRDLPPDPTFARFLPHPASIATTGTVYLGCTSAGEVGVNISADHLICDLTTFESMAQRFGRVNRFGKFDECEVHVFHPGPSGWDEKQPQTVPRQNTLELLRELEKKASASPKALGELSIDARAAAFAPSPVILPASDMLFDAWALTTITGKLPGRPSVEPYLHGLTEQNTPETYVAWREDVQLLDHSTVNDTDRAELLLAYPLLAHERLREPSYRAIKSLEVIGKRHPSHRGWLVNENGEVEQITLDWFTNKENKERINGMTVILDPRSGGLNSAGMLDGESEIADDISQTAERCRSNDEANVPSDFHEIFSLTIPAEDEDDDPKVLSWFALRNTGEVTSRKPVTLSDHVADVQRQLETILDGLSLGESLNNCLRIAARFHDDGKKRLLFQSMLGNRNAPEVWLAKSGRNTRTRLEGNYRHEFGSLNEVPTAADLDITDDERELVLHLIAAHHGRARPHFPVDEVFDPNQSDQASDKLAMTVPQRFGRLQRRYGRWGLAYLESLLRAADWSASANPNPEGEINR